MLMLINKIALMFKFEKTAKRWKLCFQVSLG